MGPRAGLAVLTLAWECRTKFAAAAWNSGFAGDGIVHCSKRASDSSSVNALPNPKRNSFWVSDTALCRLAGFAKAGSAARS